MRLGNSRALERAIGELSTRCAVMAAIHDRVGIPSLRDFTADFAGLTRIVVGQQLSASSANAIWTRVANAMTVVDAEAISNSSDDALAAHGLSRAKIKTLRALASAVRDDGLDLARLNRTSDATVAERLTDIHGIGPWTADIYLLFALRRADAFPAGDLALQLAAQRAFALSERPSHVALADLAERWRPWRGAAAHLLWADYALTRVANAAREKTPVAKKSTKVRK